MEAPLVVNDYIDDGYVNCNHEALRIDHHPDCPKGVLILAPPTVRTVLT
jgi:hypothetical protein